MLSIDNKIKQNNIRLFKNTAAMYFRTFIVMIVSLYITRVVLRELGAVDYGVYNIVGTVVVLFSFLNSSLTQAIQRFITIEQGKEDLEATNKVFCISFIVQLFISTLLLILCETAGLFVVSNYLDVDARLTAAKWVYQFSILSFVISVLRVPYEATVIANEKMTFYATVSIIEVILKLGVSLVIPYYPYDKLIIYGFLLTMVSLVSFVIYIIYCRRAFSTCKLRWVWDRKIFDEIVSFSGWSLSGSVTNIATQNLFGFLLNFFYGVILNAALGIANQVNGALNQFISNFQTSFRPQIIKSYASGEYYYFNKLISITSKISFLLAFIPVSILIINMPLVLDFWLGDYPMYTIDFCRLILLCCVFDALTGSYYCAITATGKIKKYQLYISVSFLLDLGLSAALMMVGINPEYILYSRLATRGVLNTIIGLIFMKSLFLFNVLQYLREVVIPLSLLSIIVGMVGFILLKVLNGWMLFTVSALVIMAIMLLSIKIVLTQSERANLQFLLKKIIKT